MIDFQGVAGLIDFILGAAPERLPVLLRVLWSSSERLEARIVLELVISCRDPLAPLATLCRDALKAAADLEPICNPPRWEAVDEVSRPGHATAILNLCDAALRKANPQSRERRERIRRIRPQLKVAAVREMNSRRDDIVRIVSARQAALPNLWTALETYVSGDQKRRGRPSRRDRKVKPIAAASL